jgi:CubicO group peptidase (beta-lactamase class C family)
MPLVLFLAGVASVPAVGVESGPPFEHAANRLAAVLAMRYCLLIVKDGEVVHENYFHNDTHTMYELDSLGKTAVAQVRHSSAPPVRTCAPLFTATVAIRSIAQVVGVAVTRGLIDLDRPLLEYGVPPAADWNRSGVDWYPKVTARHLLTQTSGVGEFEPGTRFTYDSDEYIQHLSPLLTRATKMSAQKFATEHWAKPLGLPHYFALDDLDGEISAGGGQLGTCRDAAKIGALVTQRGWWQGEGANGSFDGSQLVGEPYMREMVTPSYPNVSSCYGLLTWVSQAHAQTTCAGPRWPGDFTDQGRYHTCDNVSISSTPLLGDGVSPIDTPGTVGIALGYLGKLAFMVPSLNLTILTIGSSWPATPSCGYDEAFSMSQAWRALEPIYKYYKEHPRIGLRRESSWFADSPISVERASAAAATTFTHTQERKKKMGHARLRGRESSRPYDSDTPNSRQPQSRAADRARATEWHSPGADVVAQPDADKVIGSCWNLCPPYQGAPHAVATVAHLCHARRFARRLTSLCAQHSSQPFARAQRSWGCRMSMFHQRRSPRVIRRATCATMCKLQHNTARRMHATAMDAAACAEHVRFRIGVQHRELERRICGQYAQALAAAST